MDRKTATLLGAAAALAAGQVMAAPQPTPSAQPKLSYADLLEPIPNAAEQLRAADLEAGSKAPPLVQVQYYHHHHHHHHHSRWWYMHNGYSWYGGQWVLRPRFHHHHHHHHNHY